MMYPVILEWLVYALNIVLNDAFTPADVAELCGSA